MVNIFGLCLKRRKEMRFFLQQRSSKEIISILVGIKMDLKT